MSLRPPASTSTRMRVAPASRAFSSSSLNDRGRAVDDLAGGDLVGHLVGEVMRMRPISFQDSARMARSVYRIPGCNL